MRNRIDFSNANNCKQIILFVKFRFHIYLIIGNFHFNMLFIYILLLLILEFYKMIIISNILFNKYYFNSNLG